MFTILGLFFFFSIATTTKVQFHSDGGYDGIVIKIEDGVSEDLCPIILENLQKLTTEASYVLYDSLERRAWFKSVVVVVPQYWRDGKCRTVIQYATGDSPYRNGDIIVSSGKHRLYGDSPYTQQSRGCGQPGDFVSLPIQFLAALNETWTRWGDPAKLFVKEWAKYRYGIFDEIGFRNDRLYPSHYRHNGETRPTGSTNVAVKGRWLKPHGANSFIECDDLDRDEDCVFQADTVGNEAVTCSLGYLYYLPSVTTFCRRESQAVLAPTKHNVLCGGRSSMEVILSHSDFKTNSVLEDRKSVTPSFTVVRQPPPQFVLLMETSISMDARDQWRWINKAAQKFIRYDLAIDSNVAVVTFSGNGSKIEHPMTQIHNDQVRSRVADAIPDKYHLSSNSGSTADVDDVTCLLCGFQAVVHDVLFRSDNRVTGGAHIVLITADDNTRLSITDEQSITEYIKYYDLRVSSILIPNDDNKLPLEFFDSMARDSGGSSRIVKTKHKDVEVYVELMNAFSSLLPDSQSPAVVVHKNYVEMYSSFQGRFIVDSFLGHDTEFGIYVEDEEDHLIKSVSFIDSKNYQYGPYTSMSSKYDIINLKTINFPSGDAPPFDDISLLGSMWKYRIEWYSGYSRQRSAVLITSKQRNDINRDDISVLVWSDLPSKIVTSESPLTIYARVLKGRSSPVLDAAVIADLSVTMPNGTRVTRSITLLDNGNGDPDLTCGDGIYSRYLTEYPSTGRYAFDVRVDDNRGRAYFMEPFNSSMDRSYSKHEICCGSRVFVPPKRRIYTGEFKRNRIGPVVHLVSVPDLNRVDNMPPVRIGDLKIDVLPETKSLLATWTAPGDDFDSGTVAGYRFVFSDNVSTLIDLQDDKGDRKKPKTLIGFSRPDLAGTQTSFQFEFEYFDKDYFIALEAFDEADNTGKLSNIVRVHLQKDRYYPDVPRQTPVSASLPSQNEEESVMIGVLVGSFLCIAVCLWFGIWYFRHRRPLMTKNGGVNVNLDTKNTSSHQLVAPTDTVIKPSNSNSAATPVYWSASHLLDEHEQRAMYGDPPPPVRPRRSYRLDSIQEDSEDHFATYVTHSTPIKSESMIANSSQYPVVIDSPRKVPPEVPPKPSLNALLGFDEDGLYYSQEKPKKKDVRNITHV